MKKNIPGFMFVMLLCMTTLSMSCTPKDDVVPNIDDLVDVSDFSLDYASVFTEGAGAMMYISSTSLDDGDYTMYFDLAGTNPMSNVEAIMSFAGDKGTFKTPSLTNPGDMTITLKSIKDSEGKTVSITKNNVKSFTDSNGLMVWTYKGTTYTAKHVLPMLTGGNLSITGRIWKAPGIQHVLYFDNFSGSPSTCNFSKATLPTKGGSNLSTDLQLGQYGTITVTGTSPLLTGTFSYTTSDSNKVTLGTFSCKKP
jgi:hypothetical protein